MASLTGVPRPCRANGQTCRVFYTPHFFFSPLYQQPPALLPQYGPFLSHMKRSARFQDGQNVSSAHVQRASIQGTFPFGCNRRSFPLLLGAAFGKQTQVRPEQLQGTALEIFSLISRLSLSKRAIWLTMKVLQGKVWHVSR